MVCFLAPVSLFQRQVTYLQEIDLESWTILYFTGRTMGFYAYCTSPDSPWACTRIVHHQTHHGLVRILYITRLTMGLYKYYTSPDSPWVSTHIVHHQTHHGILHSPWDCTHNYCTSPDSPWVCTRFVPHHTVRL